MNKDIDFLREAYIYAQNNSTDPSTQNGALIITNRGDVVFGANHFANGVKESSERWERPLKYKFVEHAERNSVFQAAKQGISINNAIMYCPWFACADCARAIIQAGIKEIVGHDSPIHKSHPGWHDSIALALEMFDESGVSYRWIEHTFNLQIRFNEKVVTI